MAFSSLSAFACFPGEARQPNQLPDSVCVCGQQMHVQGIAIDTLRQRMYMSFTDRFIKTDYEGNILGSIDRIEGHLGAMTLSPDGIVYASLECKDDEIGAGIARKHGTATVQSGSSVFYIVTIDPQTMAMDKHVITPAVEDYNAQGHRFGCSGIDAVTFAPKPGDKSGKMWLYVAYGIYSDTTRTDNDNQILLRYDVKRWKCVDRYFVPTGNTIYGVQNMAWDAETGKLYLAVYPGKKKCFPNYSLFAVDLSSPAGSDNTLPVSGGWHFKWGSTGLCSLGDGRWYISENRKNPETGLQDCTARQYLWDYTGQIPFLPKR